MPTTKTYKHILYATDLGKHEKQIRNKVEMMVSQSKAKLSIAHVVETMPVFMDMSGYLNTAEIVDRMQKEASNLVEKQGHDLGVNAEDQYVLVGSPKTDIVSLANKLKVDLIIIGGHNRHLIDNLLGSTTDAVLRSAQCDVLTIRYKPD